MPRRLRQRIKDNALAARNDSDRALLRLMTLRDIFEPDHPEYLPLIDAMGQMQFFFQVSLGDFFEKAWGKRPKEFPSLSYLEQEPYTEDSPEGRAWRKAVNGVDLDEEE